MKLFCLNRLCKWVCMCYNVEWAWTRLGFVTILPACVLTIMYVDVIVDLPYFAVLLVLMSAVVVANFPNLAPSMHNRPIYLGDLEALEETNKNLPVDREANEIREKFFKYFFILVNVSFVLLLAAFSDYAYFLCRDRMNNTTLMEVAGVVGGVLSLWSRTQQMAGRILLVGCFHLRKRRLQQRGEEKQKETEHLTLHTILLPFQLQRHRQLDNALSPASYPQMDTTFLGV